MSLLTLPDDRVLDVRVSGPDDGLPLVFHHGTPGSGVQQRALARSAHAAGLRLVTYSRPGYGSSTRRPGRTVADVAEDVAAILDHLDAPTCLTAGKSGGGPHALATAALLPDRVGAAVSIAGVGPYGEPDLDFLAGMGEQNIEEFGAALESADACRAWLEKDAESMRGVDADGLVQSMRTLLPPIDVDVITDEFGEDLVAGMTEALRTGVDGWLDDDLEFTRPWGFDLDAIVVPTFVWQGSADLMVPYAHGEWLAEHIPGAKAHLLPDEGHFSVSVGKTDAMLAELLAAL